MINRLTRISQNRLAPRLMGCLVPRVLATPVAPALTCVVFFFDPPLSSSLDTNVLALAFFTGRGEESESLVGFAGAFGV